MLKPCRYCKTKPGTRNGVEWAYVGCVSLSCSNNPGAFYKKEFEQEVFGNWNFHGGDVPIQEGKGADV